MGTEFEAFLAGADLDYLRDAGNQALDQVETLEERLSHYRADSEIGDLNNRAAAGPVRVSPWMFQVLRRAVDLAEFTRGAFDPTMGALLAVWGYHRGRGRMPEPGEIANASTRCGYQHLELSEIDSTVRFRKEGLMLNLGAFGKGLAVDRMVEVLRELRVEAALVHGGTSTLYAMGAPPGEEAWEVGLADPSDPEKRLGTIRLRDRALSTSGDYRQFFEHEGTFYSHILDPQTGWPARGSRSATVLAGSAADSDALSTGLFVRGAAEAERLILERSGVGAILVSEDNLVLGENNMQCGRVRTWGDVAFTPSEAPAVTVTGVDE
jgi:FAD:protein FMN transferase